MHSFWALKLFFKFKLSIRFWSKKWPILSFTYICCSSWQLFLIKQFIFYCNCPNMYAYWEWCLQLRCLLFDGNVCRLILGLQTILLLLIRKLCPISAQQKIRQIKSARLPKWCNTAKSGHPALQKIDVFCFLRAKSHWKGIFRELISNKVNKKENTLDMKLVNSNFFYFLHDFFATIQNSEAKLWIIVTEIY